ncbi:hypothetical protein PIB30_104512 [Stylosanthes scabra]|uniref:Uncharacterized protein n=1 Tax=Stylosanthes scabra TaxID=79078 RepID=A0ABU6YWK0_9FABA|nr:hypothetical protein [Stylosanthes scabra]
MKAVKKKKKHEKDKSRKKNELKCCSMGNLIDKLKFFKEALHNNKNIDCNLARDNSKWKAPHAAACHDCAAAQNQNLEFGSLCQGRATSRPPCTRAVDVRESFQTRIRDTPTSESDQVVPQKSGISFPTRRRALTNISNKCSPK